MLLTELCADYIECNANIGSNGTAQLYRFSVRHFEKFLGRPPSVADLSDGQLAAYMRHRKKLGRMPTTINNEAKKLLALWRYAAAPPRLLVPPPTVQVPRLSPATPHAYLRSELRRMFRTARKSNRVIGGVPVPIYYTALLSVVFDSGERIAAIIKTERGDYDLRGRWVTLRHRKHEGQIVRKRLRRSTIRAVKKLFAAHDNESPFGYVHISTVYYHQNAIQEDAGLSVSDRRKFHAIRKSHASYLHAAGGDSTESLGHSSDEITRRVYHDPQITCRWQPIDYLFNPLGWWDRLLAWLGL
jgi:integrase